MKFTVNTCPFLCACVFFFSMDLLAFLSLAYKVLKIQVVLYVRLTGWYFFYKYYKRLKCKIKTPKSIKTSFIHI